MSGPFSGRFRLYLWNCMRIFCNLGGKLETPGLALLETFRVTDEINVNLKIYSPMLLFTYKSFNKIPAYRRNINRLKHGKNLGKQRVQRREVSNLTPRHRKKFKVKKERPISERYITKPININCSRDGANIHQSYAAAHGVLFSLLQDISQDIC